MCQLDFFFEDVLVVLDLRYLLYLWCRVFQSVLVSISSEGAGGNTFNALFEMYPGKYSKWREVPAAVVMVMKC